MRTKRSIKDSLKEYLNWCVGRLLLGGSRDDTVRDMVDAISDEIASGGGGVSQDQLDQTVKDITKSYGIADQTILTSAEQYTDQKIADVVDGSPEALDTLYELAKALGDDPNFATTVMGLIGQKLPTTTFENFVANKAWTRDNLTKLSQLVNDLHSLKVSGHSVDLVEDKLYLDNVDEFFNTKNLTSLSQLINDINCIKAGTRVKSMDVNLASISSYLRYDLFDSNTTGTKPYGLTTGFLLTFSWDNGGWGAQIATSDGNVDGAIFLRTIKASGSDKVWGPWVSLYNTANLNLDDYVKKGEDGTVTISEPEVHNGTNTFNGQVVLGDGVGISNGGNQLLGKNESGDLEIGDGTLGVDLKADLVHRVDGDQRYLIYDEDILPNPLHELATTTDLNNATDRGTYSFNSGATNTPPGMNGPGGWVLVMVNQTDKGKKTQICGGFDSNGNYKGLYTRYLPDNVNWSQWKSISGGGSSGESPVYYFPGDPSKLNSSASSTHITSILGTASDLLNAFNNGKVFISKTVTFSGVQVPSDIIYSLLKSEDPDTPTVFQIIMSIVIWGHYIEITVDFENNEYQAISNTINGTIGVNTTGTTN